MFDLKRKAKRKSLSRVWRTLGTLWSQQREVTEIYGNVTNLHLTANQRPAFQRTGTTSQFGSQIFLCKKFRWFSSVAVEFQLQRHYLQWSTYFGALFGVKKTSVTLKPLCFIQIILEKKENQITFKKYVKLRCTNRNNSSWRKIGDNSGTSWSWAHQGRCQRWRMPGSRPEIRAGRPRGTCVCQASLGGCWTLAAPEISNAGGKGPGRIIREILIHQQAKENRLS